MTTTFITGGNFKCTVAPCADSSAIYYILLPMPMEAAILEDLAVRHEASIVAVEGFDWDDDMTPWPAEGVFPGDATFKGKAAHTLERLRHFVLGRVEAYLGIPDPVRTLVGVSLSGLFALWQWTQCDLFRNIACISGSFWYDGFAQWFEHHLLEPKPGTAYFSLGKEEPYTQVKRFQPVALATKAVVAHLKDAGIHTIFEWNNGNHYAPLLPRLERAIDALPARGAVQFRSSAPA